MGKKCGLRMSLGGLLDPKRPGTGGPIVTGGIRGAIDMAEGGIVRGKGGPTDDEVPMQVAGKNVNLSNTEAVLPAKTVQALGGPEAVEELIEQTNGKPPVKGGLREGGAYMNGNLFEVDPAGNARRPGQTAGVLPPPPPGTNVAVRPVIDRTGRGAAYIDPAGSIEGEATRVKPQAAAPQAAPAPKGVYEAGRAAGSFVKQNAGKALGAAGGALAAYNTHKEAKGHDGFYSDPNVPTLDKAAQAGRTVFRTGAPLAAGAVASAAGPWTGAAVGVGTYGAINATVDKDGQAFKQWEQAQEAKRVEEHQAAVAATPQGQANAAVMAVPTQVSEKSILPQINKEAARRDTLAAAQGALADQGNTQAAQARAGNYLQRMSPEGIIMEKIRAAEANPNTDPRQLAYLGKALRYQRLDENGKAAVNMGADVDTVQQKHGATVGRERNGQLVVTAGHQYTPAQHEGLRAQEAERMRSDLNRQSASLQKGGNQTLGDLVVEKMYARRAGKQQERDLKAQEAASLDAYRKGSLTNEARKAEALERYNEDVLTERGRQFDITSAAAAKNAAKESANERLKSLDKALDGVNLPENDRKDFKMKVNSGYLKDLKDKDGNLVAEGLASADATTQLAAQQRLMATYLQTERANQHSTNGKSATQFERKRGSRLRPEDLHQAEGSVLPTLYDDDPATMDLLEYAKRRIGPTAWWGGDRVDVGTNGVRVPANVMSKPFTDADENLVMGDMDVRRQRKTMADAAR